MAACIGAVDVTQSTGSTASRSPTDQILGPGSGRAPEASGNRSHGRCRREWPLAFDPVGAPLFGGVFAQLVLGSLGALAVTSNLIRTTFAVTPQRRKTFAAKAAVIGVTGLVVGAVLLGTAFFINEAVMGPAHGGVSLSQPGVFRTLGYAVLYITIITLLGVGIGAIVRHTAGAITVPVRP